MKLTDAELKLMNIIWENNNSSSMKLVEICNEKLGWKKSTMYTILKKLEQKGMVNSENTIVSYIVSNEDYEDSRKKYAIEHYFNNSLPSFLTAFARERKLNKEDIDELEKIIEQYREQEDE